MHIGTGIYVKHSNEAAALYMEAFGLTMGYNVKNPDGTFFHSELCKNGTEVLSVIESVDDRHEDKTVQLGVILDSEDEVRRVFDILSKDAIIDSPPGPLPWSPYAATFVDKFGVWWYISAPQHRPPDDFDPTSM